jgi:CBS domain-containing protein
VEKMAASVNPPHRREVFRRRLRDQGPVALKTNLPKKVEGEIMRVAKSPVTAMTHTTPVYDAVKIMVKEGFRRMPIVEPGTQSLLGLVTATDIIDFFGGGNKFQLIQRKYNGNFFKAINEPIGSIMTQDVVSIYTTTTINQALEIMKRHKIGGLPIIDDHKHLLAILTEHDIVSFFAGLISGVKVTDLMSRRPLTANPNMSIFEAEKTMVEQGFRRLPIVVNNKVVGMATVRDVLRFFGSGQVFRHLRSGTIAQVLQTSVLEIATRDVNLVKPDIDVGEVAELMRVKNVGSVLVTENEKLVGIITERDFFKLIA